MRIPRILCGLMVALLIISTSVAVWAQAGTGELTGLVTDPTGAVLSAGKIELTNAQTGLVYVTATSSAGMYRFVGLPVVGTYTLTMQPTGFKAVKVANIVISVGTTITQDIKLEVGMAGETVTVEAGAELVQTGDASVSGLVDRRIWETMPLEVRNQNSFIELVAGAVQSDQTGNTRGSAVNGARGGASNYQVEGFDNNDQGQAGRGQLSGYDAGGAVTSISPEAIQEYRVITNGFAAEYGKGGGFVTDTVLKSGTNQWHGSLFEYNRVQALAANGFFSNRNDIKDSLVRNQFGGSIGGPIIKDKTFFYASVEGHRARSAATLHATGTTQQFLDFVKNGGLQTWAESSPNGLCNNQTFLDSFFGDGTAGSSEMAAAPCPNKFPNSATIGPIFDKMAAVGPFPLATTGLSSTGGGYYTADLTYPVPVYGDVFVSDPYHLNEYRISGKFDHKFSDQDQVNFLYLMQDAESGDPYQGGYNTIGPPSIEKGRSTNIGIGWNHTFTPTILNNFKISYLRHVQNYPSPSAAYDTMPQIYTWFDPMSVGLGLYGGLPQYFTDNQFQYQDHLSFIRGKHSFKTGAEYRRTRNGSSFFNDRPGTFTPNGVEDLLTDLYFTDEAAAAFGVTSPGSSNLASAAVDPTTGKLPIFYRGYRANEFAAYFQDDWRIHSRVTLNLGMRWEYFGPPHNFKANIDSNVYFGSPATPAPTATNNAFFPNTPFYATVATADIQVRNHEIWNKDTNNFSPRLGVAWDVFGTQKLVIRAGAGLMYDRIWNNLFENIRFNPPFYSDNQIGDTINGNPVGALSSPGLYSYPFTSTAMFNDPTYAPVPNPRHMDQNMVTPYYEQAHFGAQWEFLKGYVVEPEYIGTFGHKLTGYYDLNTFNGRVACPPPSTPYTSGPCFNAGYVNGFSTQRINPALGADNFRTNAFASNYHALQLTVRKNFTNGFRFEGHYTYSKALDDLSDAFQYRTSLTDTMNLKSDYGPADFNLKHRLVANLSYDLPFFKQNRWLGGWGINSIISLQGGMPFSPYSSSSRNDLNKNATNNERVLTNGGIAPMSTVPGKLSPADGYFDPTQWAWNSATSKTVYYTCPTTVNQGLWCDVPIGRNSMTGPGFKNVDFNLTKKFKMTERTALSFQANFFNLFNHPNFKLPDNNRTSPTFGKSVDAYDPRVTQLALRLDF
jgi:Carboxypeptidase regulatory-like domain